MYYLLSASSFGLSAELLHFSTMAKRPGEIDDLDAVDEVVFLVKSTVPLSRYTAEQLLPKLRALQASGIPREAMTIVDSGNTPVIVVAFRISEVQQRIEELHLSGVDVKSVG